VREGKSTIAHPSRPKNKPPLSPFEIYAKTPVEPEPGERQLQTGKCPATLLPINPSCCGCRDVGQQIFEIYRVKFRLEKVNLSSERLKQYDRPECSEIGCLGSRFLRNGGSSRRTPLAWTRGCGNAASRQGSAFSRIAAGFGPWKSETLWQDMAPRKHGDTEKT
jgi:hypothetical protein